MSGRCQLELMRCLIGFRAEEATFTFSGVDCEAPFQGPFFKVVKVQAAFSGSEEED